MNHEEYMDHFTWSLLHDHLLLLLFLLVGVSVQTRFCLGCLLGVWVRVSVPLVSLQGTHGHASLACQLDRLLSVF